MKKEKQYEVTRRELTREGSLPEGYKVLDVSEQYGRLVQDENGMVFLPDASSSKVATLISSSVFEMFIELGKQSRGGAFDRFF